NGGRGGGADAVAGEKGEEIDADEDGGGDYLRAPGTMAETIAVRQRMLERPGSITFGLSAGLGTGATGALGDERGLAVALDGQVGYTLPAELMVQARVGLLMLRGDQADETLGHLLLELAWLKLRLLELSAGGGLSLGNGTHATLGGALDVRLPLRQFDPALELRYQNIIVPGAPNPDSLTVGVQLRF
ncbi:MAG TPA: hypothetical protein VL172_21115, partial [Kofleriaceae bacterium]|nr:hypothetical protein [Kofleriaceae bacterium]